MMDIIFSWLLGFATSLFIFAVWAADLKADKDNYKIKYDDIRLSYNSLLFEHNYLVENNKHLIEYIKSAGKDGALFDISDDDIKKLLLLCHPDKHGGKTLAHEMTQKLLAMRSK